METSCDGLPNGGYGAQRVALGVAHLDLRPQDDVLARDEAHALLARLRVTNEGEPTALACPSLTCTVNGER